LGGIYPDGNQGGDGKEDASRGQPALCAADFAWPQRGPQPPQKPVLQRSE
jgi:hypothetical protein